MGPEPWGRGQGRWVLLSTLYVTLTCCSFSQEGTAQKPLWTEKQGWETGVSYGPQLTKGPKRDSYSQCPILPSIAITNGLEGKITDSLLKSYINKSMDEGKWCQHQHCSFGDHVSYLVLLLGMKNSQCFYNLQRVPNTVLITLLILTLIFTKSLMKWVLLLTLFIDEKTEAVEM